MMASENTPLEEKGGCEALRNIVWVINVDTMKPQNDDEVE